MSVHSEYSKRYNQARDIRRILLRAATRPVTRPDHDRLWSIADDLRATADLVKHGGYLIAILSWPEDPERGSEPYGPFKDEPTRMDWVNEVSDAAAAGDTLLKGVEILLTRLDPPFPVQR